MYNITTELSRSNSEKSAVSIAFQGQVDASPDQEIIHGLAAFTSGDAGAVSASPLKACDVPHPLQGRLRRIV